MKSIYIKDKKGLTHVFYLKFNKTKFKKIKVDDVCVIYINKYHNHRYDIKCFFFNNDYIYYDECISTLKKLYDIIQSLLQENLYSAIQN